MAPIVSVLQAAQPVVDGEADSQEEGAGGLGGAGGAERYARLVVGPNGLITRGVAERMVQVMADGLTEREAWTAAGQKQAGSSDTRTRAAIVASPVFQMRLAMLQDEKTKLEDRGPHGEALWCAKQTFRAAQLKDDLQTQMRAAQLIASISEKMAPAAEPGDPAAAARGPGRPASEQKNTKVNIARIAEDLVKMGQGPKPNIDLEPAAKEEDLPL